MTLSLTYYKLETFSEVSVITQKHYAYWLHIFYYRDEFNIKQHQALTILNYLHFC